MKIQTARPNRLPFLLWGDLRKNKKALLRYALAGEEAHLPIYFYVYLREFFEYKKLCSLHLNATNLKEIRKKVQTVYPQGSWLLGDDQISRAYFISIIADHEKNLNVWELGSTLFTISTKVDYLNSVFGKKSKIKYFGIEKNKYLSQLSKILHPNCRIYSDKNYLNPLKKKNKNLFVSRFVSSYVFEKTEYLADQLTKFDYGYLTEPFNLDEGENLHYNHGLPNAFFDFVKLLQKLLNSHDCFSAGHYYDHPAGTSLCFVCNLVFISKNLKSKKDIQKKLKKTFDLFQQIENPTDYLAQVRSGITKTEKRSLEILKKLNPVWGKADLSQPPIKNLLTLIKSKPSFYKNYKFKFNNYYLIKNSLANQLL